MTIRIRIKIFSLKQRTSLFTLGLYNIYIYRSSDFFQTVKTLLLHTAKWVIQS